MEQPLHVTVKKGPLLPSSFCEHMQHSGPGEDTEEESATTLHETGADTRHATLLEKPSQGHVHLHTKMGAWYICLGTSATSDIYVSK